MKEKIQRIQNKKLCNRHKVDCLLKLDCNQYVNLGIDSTEKDVKDAKENSRKIYEAIQELDYGMGKLFLEAMS